MSRLRPFLRHVEADELYAAWLLFCTTGAREAEVGGLTWPDLDLDAGWMRVEWTLGMAARQLIWKPRPKSKAGRRVMALDPATVAALREDAVRPLREAVRRSRPAPNRPHDVRHSYASAALASATDWHDVKVLSQRLRHANVAITLDTYSHVLPAADETMTHTLASVMPRE